MGDQAHRAPDLPRHFTIRAQRVALRHLQRRASCPSPLPQKRLAAPDRYTRPIAYVGLYVMHHSDQRSGIAASQPARFQR